MASYTPNLNLLKKSPVTDGNDTFNVDTMLNENWDKIDNAVLSVIYGSFSIRGNAVVDNKEIDLGKTPKMVLFFESDNLSTKIPSDNTFDVKGSHCIKIAYQGKSSGDSSYLTETGFHATFQTPPAAGGGTVNYIAFVI